MLQVTDELQRQVDEIKGMMFRNIQLIVDYNRSPEGEKPMSKQQFDKLVFRTDLLAKCVKDAEEVIESKKP